MRKMLIFVFSMVLLLKLVSAVNIGVVVTYPNGTDFTQCIGVNENIDGYDTLNNADLSIDWSDAGQYGHALCKISSIGDEVSGTSCQWGADYWGLFLVNGNSWGYLPVGMDAPGDCWNRDYSSWLGHYCSAQGDVLGFAYGPYGKEPAFYSYDNVCPNKLKIDDLTVYVDGSKESKADENGGKIKDVKPESNVKLKIKVENLYTDDENIEIRDIGITGTIKDIDDGDDIEEEADDFDLEAEDKETAELEFEIPMEVEDGDYDLVLTVKSKDENDVEHNHAINFELEIKKEKHELKFTRAELSNYNIKCSRSTELSVKLVNMGTKEEGVTLKITNDALAINEKDTFTLNEDPFDDESAYSNSYLITISDNAIAGTYPITIGAGYSDKTQKTTVDLTIEDCEVTEETKIQTLAEQAETPTTATPVAATTQQTTAAAAAQSTANIIATPKVDNARIIMTGIVAIEILVIAGGSILVIKWVKK